MRSDPLRWRAVFAAVCGIAVATGVVVYRAQADEWDKKTILTVNQPIQVRDRLLEPGQYVFKLLDSQSNRHIVQIFNSDQSRLVDTIMAIPNYRLQPTGDSRFAFWETPRGSARALRAWFYPGDNFGQEFPYPKHLATIETASVTTAAPPPPAPPPQAETPPTPEPQATVKEPEPQQPVEIAQNAPPPTAAPAPEPPAQEPPTLPKTASPYPMIGLSGLFSLGIYGLLRLKRSA
jgi:hypothetical protein